MACPMFNKNVFDDYIHNVPPEIDLSTLQTCEDDQPRKRFRVGGTRSTDVVKALIYVLLAFLTASALLSDDMEAVRSGLRMVMEGRCNTVGNLTMYYLGLGNPVCNQYRTMMTFLPELVANPRLILSCIQTRGARIVMLPTCIDLVARILTGDGDRQANIARLTTISGITLAITAGSRRTKTRKRKSNRRRRTNKY